MQVAKWTARQANAAFTQLRDQAIEYTTRVDDPRYEDTKLTFGSIISEDFLPLVQAGKISRVHVWSPDIHKILAEVPVEIDNDIAALTAAMATPATLRPREDAEEEEAEGSARSVRARLA